MKMINTKKSKTRSKLNCKKLIAWQSNTMKIYKGKEFRKKVNYLKISKAVS